VQRYFLAGSLSHALYQIQDVEKAKRRIRACVTSGDLEGARGLYNQWMALLDELIFPPHQE
jgi:hypothetical protein